MNRKSDKEREGKVLKYNQWVDPEQTHSHITFRDPKNLKPLLVLKLREHRLKLSKFLRLMCELLLAEDGRIMDLLDDVKVKKKIQSINEVAKLRRERNKTTKAVKTFNLSQEEIDEIYDVVEIEKDQE